MPNNNNNDGGTAPSAEPVTRAQKAIQLAQRLVLTSQSEPAMKLFEVDYTEIQAKCRHLKIAAPADCEEDDLALAIGNILAYDGRLNFVVEDLECRAMDAANVAEFNLAYGRADFVLTRDEHGQLVRQEPSVRPRPRRTASVASAIGEEVE